MNGNLAYQEEIREELIQGQVVAMSPRPGFNHNHISFNIANLFANFLRGHTCTVIADGTDLYLDEDNLFVPDMMVVCDRSKIRRDGVHGAPDLVVEVLSPSTGKRDKTVKKDVYAKHGVGEYWLVDPIGKSVELYLLEDGAYVLHNVCTVHPDWMLEGMKPEERAQVETTFRCHLYEDFELSLDDIFSGMVE